MEVLDYSVNVTDIVRECLTGRPAEQGQKSAVTEEKHW